MTMKTLIEPVLNALNSRLEPLGFKRNKYGRVWNRMIENYIDIIELQKSGFSNSLTVNCGVSCMDVYRITWGKEPKKIMIPAEGIVEIRLGHLVYGKDTWWEYEEILDSPGILIDPVMSGGVSFCEKMHSENEIMSSLEKERFLPACRRLEYVVLLCKHGEKKKAEELINKEKVDYMKVMIRLKYKTEEKFYNREVGLWDIRLKEIEQKYGLSIIHDLRKLYSL